MKKQKPDYRKNYENVMLFKDTVKALRMLKAKRGDKTYSATLDFLMKKYGEEK